MRLFLDEARILLQPLKASWLSYNGIEASLLRLDLLHPEISGNKGFKLKYNIEAAIREGKNTILTFGGPYSNHIAATAAACKLLGLKSIGLIRGEPFSVNNFTLTRAKKHGMQLRFMTREQYRHKEAAAFLKRLQMDFPQAFIVPEGGNNIDGVKGAREILRVHDTTGFTHICCPVGTGTTLAGLIAEAKTAQKILGFSALKKTDEQIMAIKQYLEDAPAHAEWQIIMEYHFGGFARKTETLLAFMKAFEQQHGIPLDFIYTAKMLFGIKELVRKKKFPAGSKLLLIHTGGLQGNRGMYA